MLLIPSANLRVGGGGEMIRRILEREMIDVGGFEEMLKKI
jgi:hypothetical protein